MNITTDMIRRSVADGIAVRSQYKSGIEEQKKRERDLLKGHSFCTKQNANRTFGSPNLDILEDAVKRQFYNADVMSAVACVSDSLVFTQGGLNVSDRIRDHLIGLHQIGDASANGTAFVADLVSGPSTNVADDLFVIKAPQSSSDADEMAHEVAVGFATNALRPFVPNFAYIFGYFSCSGPVVKDKDVVAWCQGSGPGSVGYALYENIQNAVSLKSYLKTSSPRQIWHAYIQILMALRSAQNRVQFTHYDLHTENILVRKVSAPEFFIPIDEFYVKAEGVCTIIDYGMSHVEWKSSAGRFNLGYVGKHAPLTMYGVHRDRMHPMHDAYKLLGFILFDLLHEQSDKSYIPINDSYKQLAPALRFFNKTDNPLAIPVMQREFFFSVPSPIGNKDYNKEISKFRLDEFIDYCRQYSVDRGWSDPLVDPSVARGRVLKCQTSCYDPSSLLRPSGPPFSNLLEFYDVYMPLVARVNDATQYGRMRALSEANLELHTFLTTSTDYLDAAISKERERIRMLNQRLIRKQYLNLQDSVSWLKKSKKAVEANASEMAIWLDAYHRLHVIEAVLTALKTIPSMPASIGILKNEVSHLLDQAESYSPKDVITRGVEVISPQSFGKPLSSEMKAFLETPDGMWYHSLYQNLIAMTTV